MIAGTGHLPHMEKAAAVTGLMMTFLQQDPTSSG